MVFFDIFTSGKKLLLIAILPFGSIFCFSQDFEIEKITFVELDTDGSRRVTRTVDAVFVTWVEMECRHEGNLLAIYQTTYIDDEWSDWELTERSPMQGTLGQLYDAYRRTYALVPNLGIVYPWDEDFSVLKMMDIPQGSSSPIRWGTDGTSFFIFCKMYSILE